MERPGEFTAFVTAVFQEWRRASVNYLVLRNYEQLPHQTSNDIDVLVTRRHLKRAEAGLMRVAKTCGFRLVNRAEFATLALYFAARDSTTQVHFDLFTRLAWRGFNFLECDDFLWRKVERDLFFVPNPVDEAAANLLAYTIYSGAVKEKYRGGITAAFRAEPLKAEDLLARSYGRANARFLVKAAGTEDWEGIHQAIPRLRRRLIFRHLNRWGVQTAWRELMDAWRLAKRWLRPPGIFVVVSGPDGCGKSTVADRLITELASTFSPGKGRHLHWKPARLFPKRGSASGGETDPHGRPPRGRAASILYFAAHWLEFVVGSRLLLRPTVFRGGMVLVERYYYDFLVDQRRYRLAVPQWLIRAGGLFVRKPELLLVLDAPTPVLRSRKQEVPESETERQRQEYLKLTRAVPIGVVLNAAQPVQNVVSDAARSILEYLAARQGDR